MVQIVQEANHLEAPSRKTQHPLILAFTALPQVLRRDHTQLRCNGKVAAMAEPESNGENAIGVERRSAAWSPARRRACYRGQSVPIAARIVLLLHLILGAQSDDTGSEFQYIWHARSADGSYIQVVFKPGPNVTKGSEKEW